MNEQYLPKKTKRLVMCPTCEVNGRKEVLGEVNEEGNFSIMRFHNGKTVIMSSSYSVICGGCGKIVFNKLESIEGTVNIWG